MTVARGTRLGPYEISSPIGSGGMGEVYRARDTRLDRDVAIKVLPAEFAADAQFKLRLEREAKTISALNDPHICTLYDVGDNYLVMELLDGETLAERLLRGPLPTDEVLRLGVQAANALDRAHKQGIVHRDLKPGNIMLTKSGVKLLDFGLAKSNAPLTDFSGSTQHRPLTKEGTIVGTFQYMAPEQLEGAEADARTDIFALGALIYEMATGRRAFEGKTRTSLIAAIVSGQPTPVSQIQPLTPPALEHVIERCLEKDPADRWQSAHDVAEELKWISAKGSQAGIAAPIAARRKTRERMYWLIALAAVIAAAAAVELRREPPRIVQTSILPPEKTQFAFDQAGPPALSPDGRRIVYVAQPASGSRMLYVRSLSAVSAQPLAGTEDAMYPFWSPDNRMIGFFAGGKLKKMDASGGPVQTIADAPIGRGGTWSQREVIVFAPSSSGPLFKVSEDGGTVSPVTRIDASRGDSTHRMPSFLPDGRHFIYLAQRAAVALDQGGTLAVGSVEGDMTKALTNASSNAVYSSSGHLVYWRDRSLVAQKFDAKSLTAGRNLIPIAENVARTNRGDAAFALSSEGTIVYQTGAAVANSQLRWVDIQGKALEPIGKPADYRTPSLSNDGRRVLTAVADPATGRFDLWIIDLQRAGTPTRLTFDAADEFAPIWSPDDSMVAFSSDAKGSGDLMLKRSTGTGGEDVLYANNRFKVAADWSPDLKTILFQEQNPNSGWDLTLYSLDDHKARVFLQTPFNETGARFSPDGRWIAYQSDEQSGKAQIYVLPLSGNRGKWQISTDGGTRLRWSRDGKRIFYVSPDFTLMAVDVAAHGDEFTAAVPRALFPLNIKRMNGQQYDISADGKRVLINSPIEQTEVAPLTLVQNWTAALKK